MSQETGQLARYFDSRAASYDSMLEQVRYQIPEWIRGRAGQLGAGTTVLDLGCGNGILGRLLTEEQPDLRFDGVDLSPAMVAAARASERYQSVHEHDISTGLPKPIIDGDTRYDLILAFGVLEFLESPVALLRDAASVLGPGGRMWISFEKTEPDSDGSGDVREELGFRMYHHDVDSVRANLAVAGLAAQQIETMPAYQRTYDRKQIVWWVLDISRLPSP